MNALNALKKSVSFVVGAGVSHIITEIVTQNVPQENLYQQVVVFAGRVGLTMVISEVVEEHMGQFVEELVTAVQNTRTSISEAK